MNKKRLTIYLKVWDPKNKVHWIRKNYMDDSLLLRDEENWACPKVVWNKESGHPVRWTI